MVRRQSRQHVGAPGDSSPALRAALALAISAVGGCAPYVRPSVFTPAPSQGVVTYFANGQPFAIRETDSAFVAMSISPSAVAGQTYLRVWLLYKNKTAETVLLSLRPALVPKL